MFYKYLNNITLNIKSFKQNSHNLFQNSAVVNFVKKSYFKAEENYEFLTIFHFISLIENFDINNLLMISRIKLVIEGLKT